MLKSSIEFLLHDSSTCFAAVVLFFGLTSLVDVIPRLMFWDISGIRSSVSSRSVLERVQGIGVHRVINAMLPGLF
jgi:hypothetical protein